MANLRRRTALDQQIVKIRIAVSEVDALRKKATSKPARPSRRREARTLEVRRCAITQGRFVQRLLLVMAGAAGAEDTTRLIGDFYHADCPLDDCPRPPSSPGLGSAAGVPESADKAKTLSALEYAAYAKRSTGERGPALLKRGSCALTRRTCSQ
jgi:hypothetical protein